VRTETVPETEPEPPAAAPAVRYGTQVLASSRQMKETDPYFAGYRVTAVRAGSLYKYILEVSDDLETARKALPEIRKKFKDAFLVEIRNESVTRYK
jgi:hypothetical protein